MVDRFGDGLLTPRETASYLKIPQPTLRSWLKVRAAGAPLVHQVDPPRKGQPSVPFIGVAEAHALRSLRALGLRISEIREAATTARDAFATPYGLVSKRIATDGVCVLAEDMVSDYLRDLYWKPDDDFPSGLRLTQQYPDSVPVVLDPRFGHGRPVVAANRVAVKAIIDLWEAGESVEDIAYDFDMTPEQVAELCRADQVPGRVADASR
ncbi:DUF433 domain-containing protein [Streptomyces olivaceus]|uniref:DUF433 domain-containing protein n=1 Tax=Streptomyces olivaceus TaxID=47716 RepID=UPI0036A93A95